MKVLQELPMMMNTSTTYLPQANWRNMPTPAIVIEDHIFLLTNCKTTANQHGTENNTKQQYKEMASTVTLLNMGTKQSSHEPV